MTLRSVSSALTWLVSSTPKFQPCDLQWLLLALREPCEVRAIPFWTSPTDIPGSHPYASHTQQLPCSSPEAPCSRGLPVLYLLPGTLSAQPSCLAHSRSSSRMQLMPHLFTIFRSSLLREVLVCASPQSPWLCLMTDYIDLFSHLLHTRFSGDLGLPSLCPQLRSWVPLPGTSVDTFITGLAAFNQLLPSPILPLPHSRVIALKHLIRPPSFLSKSSVASHCPNSGARKHSRTLPTWPQIPLPCSCTIWALRPITHSGFPNGITK